MGWFMTIPQVLVALLVVLPIGFLGVWLRRAVMRAYRRDLTSWLAIASGVLFGCAAIAYYSPPPSYLKINTAIILTLLSSLLAFVSLGALMLGKDDSPLLSAALYCLLALPLIAASVFVLFVLVWSGAHLNR
jgi:hypothetical protein